MEKVIFDTQVARNPEAKKFLGNRNELEQFVKVAEIILPDVVIEEIKNQKRRNLKSKKQSFLDNPFHWLRKLDHDETKKIDIELHITDLEKNENLKYSVIKLSNYSVLEQMKELAFRKLPPFEAAENNDKGFKDACIYFTILEYLQSIKDKRVLVCCKDGRLKEAFEKHPNIIVIESFDEFIQNSITVFFDDYFIEKLKTDIHADIEKKSIIDYWFNINEDRVLLIEVGDDKYVVEVDSGEIVSSSKIDAYSYVIENLINSVEFEATHSAVETLNFYINFLSDDEIVKIIKAACSNEQIYRIIDSEDVKQFISILYEKKKDILTPEIKADIKERLE